MKYLIVKSVKNNNSFTIAEFDLVSGVTATKTEIELVDGVYFSGVDNIELSESQVTRFQEGSKDLTYIITGTPTPEPESTLEDLKLSKLTTLTSNYETKLGLGYTSDTITVITQIATEEVEEETEDKTITLRCDDVAKAKFTQMKSHLQGIETGIYPIWDKLGMKHYLSVQVYKSLLIAYGDYLINQEEVYNDKQTLIEIAESESELDSIVIEF